MKKILILLFILASITANGQPWKIHPTYEARLDSSRWTFNFRIGYSTPDSINTTLIKADSGVFVVLDYDPPHGAMSFADSSAVIALSQNTWGKVTNAANDLFTVQDADDITIAGDSMTIQVAGDYIINWSLSFEGTSNDIWQIVVYKNAVLESVKMSRKTSNGDTGNMGLPAYVENLMAGDDLSFYIRNTGDNDDATMVSSSVIIYMLHPD